MCHSGQDVGTMQASLPQSETYDLGWWRFSEQTKMCRQSEIIDLLTVMI